MQRIKASISARDDVLVWLHLVISEIRTVVRRKVWKSKTKCSSGIYQVLIYAPSPTAFIYYLVVIYDLQI